MLDRARINAALRREADAIEGPYGEVVRLRLAGLGPHEIAAQTGVHYHTVRSRLSRGLLCLRERLVAVLGEALTLAREDGTRQRTCVINGVARLQGAIAMMKPNYVGRLLLLGVLMASARCDCNQNGDSYINPGDLPLAMGWATCNLLRCCEHHVVEDQCMMRISEAETWIARTNELGLRYDVDCALKFYFYGPYECSVFEQNEHYWACDEVCALYHGSAALDEPCELVGLHMSTCANDLVCGPDERCHAPCDAPELALAGQRCGAALGLPCATGLACVASGRCVDAMPLGSACDVEQPCDVDGWCSASSLCEARVEDGQACELHEQCLSQLCEAGGCVAPTLPYCVNPVL